MLSADEVARSLAGSIDLIGRNARALQQFPASIDAFWRSFGAIVLTAPAFVATLAADRVRLGLPLQEGLFADPGLVLLRLMSAGLAWITFPILMIAVVRRLGLGHRYVGFVVAYNWTAVVVSALLAVPSALYAMGFASYALSTLFVTAFAVIAFQMRWFLAKAALGVSGGLAAVIAFVDLGVYGLIGAAVAVVASA